MEEEARQPGVSDANPSDKVTVTSEHELSAPSTPSPPPPGMTTPATPSPSRTTPSNITASFATALERGVEKGLESLKITAETISHAAASVSGTVVDFTAKAVHDLDGTDDSILGPYGGPLACVSCDFDPIAGPAQAAIEVNEEEKQKAEDRKRGQEAAEETDKTKEETGQTKEQID